MQTWKEKKKNTAASVWNHQLFSSDSCLKWNTKRELCSFVCEHIWGENPSFLFLMTTLSKAGSPFRIPSVWGYVAMWSNRVSSLYAADTKLSDMLARLCGAVPPATWTKDSVTPDHCACRWLFPFPTVQILSSEILLWRQVKQNIRQFFPKLPDCTNTQRHACLGSLIFISRWFL